MRRLHLALMLLLIAGVSVAYARGRAFSTANFTPPPEAGVIYAVVDFARASGRAQTTVVNVEWGSASRRVTIAPPYRGTCAETTPSGFVLKMRHPRPDTVPMTVTTTGTLVHGPYQGDIPLELLNACYHLVT
jgi:hypothetical protein